MEDFVRHVRLRHRSAWARPAAPLVASLLCILGCVPVAAAFCPRFSNLRPDHRPLSAHVCQTRVSAGSRTASQPGKLYANGHRNRVVCVARTIARQGQEGDGSVECAALLHACKEGDLSAVQQSLKSGACTTATDDWGTTCLHLAVKAGHAEVVKVLLQAGSNPDCASMTDDETSPLHYAVQKGCLEIAEILLANGATATKKDEFGDMPLDIAKRINNRPMVQLLKSKSVAQNVVADGSTGSRAGQGGPSRSVRGAARVQYGDGHMGASEARKLVDEAVDWDAAELGREVQDGSVVEVVTDSETGEQFLRRVPLKKGARNLFPAMEPDSGNSAD